jgi:BirA family biotin operon repressor/biotin-[acetyl-CoA-carboxylase] ligase
MSVNTRELISQLRVIESVAIISRVDSTNQLARRVIAECINNELALPSAVIIALEQTAGRGRASRTWHSPAARGIYATFLHSRRIEHLSNLPMQMASLVAGFLRETYALDAGIKWPNDIVLNNKKIAGILIEARTRDGEACAAIGVGINVAAVDRDLAPFATSITEGLHGRGVSLDDATTAFIRSLDRGLSDLIGIQSLPLWKQWSIHQAGDRITVRLGERELRGRWQGIDEFGRALIHDGDDLHEISAADLILME